MAVEIIKKTVGVERYHGTCNNCFSEYRGLESDMFFINKLAKKRHEALRTNCTNCGEGHIHWTFSGLVWS